LSAEGAKGEFAVITGAEGFANDGGAGGLKSGEQDAAFDLRAGNGHRVVDRSELGSANRNGSVAFRKGHFRTHFCERFAHALHGAARERFVSDEGEAALLGCEETGDHTHSRSGVAAVERMIYGGNATADSVDFDATVIEFANARAEGLHAGEGGGAIGSGGEVGEARCASGERTEHGITVAD